MEPFLVFGNIIPTRLLTFADYFFRMDELTEFSVVFNYIRPKTVEIRLDSEDIEYLPCAVNNFDVFKSIGKVMVYLPSKYRAKNDF